MSTCKRIKVDKNKICLGDYRHPISIQTRSIQPPGIGETQPTELFATLIETISAVKTLGTVSIVSSTGVRKFNGINIDPSTTHLFFVQYADIYMDVEVNNNYILFMSKYYKLTSAPNNINEDSLTVMYQAALRGDSSKEASEA